MMRTAFVAVSMLANAALAAPPTRSAADAPERAADSRDKMICKKFIETGSLVRGYRTCKTKWEWERERENLRALGVSDSCRSRAEPDPSRTGGGGGCGL